MKIQVTTRIHKKTGDSIIVRTGTVLMEYPEWYLVKFKNYKEGISKNEEYKLYE